MNKLIIYTLNISFNTIFTCLTSSICLSHKQLSIPLTNVILKYRRNFTTITRTDRMMQALPKLIELAPPKCRIPAENMSQYLYFRLT